MRCSVVMAAYQRADAIGRAIESVLGQTEPPDEIIVVDDGSTDGTGDVARRYMPLGVTVISQANRERGAARNAGVAASSSDVVAFIDSDDEWRASHLATIMRAFAGSDDVLVHTQAEFYDIVRDEIFFVSGSGSDGRHEFEGLLRGNPVPFSAAAVRRDAFNAVGGFEEDRALSTVEDWDLWIRLAAVGAVASLSDVTVRVNFHLGNSVHDAERHAAAHLVLRNRVLSHPRVVREDLARSAFVGSVSRLAQIRRQAGRPKEALLGIVSDLQLEPSVLRDPETWRALAGAAADIGRRRQGRGGGAR